MLDEKSTPAIASRPIVLVTGANGFVGRHLTPVLSRAGWTVRRAVRSSRSSIDDEVVVGSIGPSTDWSEALTGVQAVVHLAARVHQVNEESAIDVYRTINVEGTLQLARSAAKAGVKRFVFVSTMLVHGSCTDERAPFRETDELAPRGVYGVSKAEAELGLKQLSSDLPMSLTVVRPPLVYGPGALGNFHLLVKAVRSGTPLPFGAVHNRRAFVGVQNLASFIANRLTRNEKPFDVFLVADKEQVSTPEFIFRLARAMDRKARLFPAPRKALELLLRASGRPRIRDSLIGGLEVDLSKLTATDWQQELTMDEGLSIAVRTADV
ncbi:NAD-dependent epimerase/dehydratase family protein [Bradyrhizobium sp. Leo121]|uniref:NAD-dependent epimerase/dehydratase family protein n=1 Tax=Bradyrhizobium sp. Leo121 TaxID=1571195 RepID=UPI00102A9644|nr:NAD-dependent epimerase/dehydratase family protein [Bradyrhizobium sp. Leo121]RZN35410.1 UDP-glucose 4-epimerase [Bradyrhizobium sp. Leo121]